MRLVVSDEKKAEMAAAVDRILADHPEWNRSDVETVLNAQNGEVPSQDIVQVEYDGTHIMYNGSKFSKSSESNAFMYFMCTKTPGGQRCGASLNLIKSAKEGRVLAIILTPNHNHRVRVPANYNSKTGRAIILEDFMKTCVFIVSKGSKLTEQHFENGISLDYFEHLSDELKSAVTKFNYFCNIFKHFRAKFGGNLKGSCRAYAHLHVDANFSSRMFWLKFLRYIGQSKNNADTRTEGENARFYRVKDLCEACGSSIFPSLQIVVDHSEDFVKSAEALMQSLFEENADGHKQLINIQYETCPKEYLFENELLNLAVGAYLLVRALFIGRTETIYLRPKHSGNETYLKNLGIDEKAIKTIKKANKLKKFFKKNNIDPAHFLFNQSTDKRTDH